MLIDRKREAQMVVIFDTTLRDGIQQDGVNISAHGKSSVITLLDDFGVDYIEVGWPGTNKVDDELMNMLPATVKSKLVIFGATRRKDRRAEDDELIQQLITAPVSTVCIFGKTWDKHVTDVIGTTLQHNLDMISDTIQTLIKAGKQVFFDCEHFFDGYKYNREYSLECVKTAVEAGAEYIVLCDTNGGTLPDDIIYALKDVMTLHDKVGLHLHDDIGTAVAASMKACAMFQDVMIQGTINGLGERIGNCNLTTLIGNLLCKDIAPCGCDIALLKHVSDKIAEITGVPNKKQQYTGYHAFCHKAGVHSAAVLKWSGSYEHIDPHVVGNDRYFPLSNMSGRSIVADTLKRIGSKESIEDVLKRLKEQ